MFLMFPNPLPTTTYRATYRLGYRTEMVLGGPFVVLVAPRVACGHDFSSSGGFFHPNAQRTNVRSHGSTCTTHKTLPDARLLALSTTQLPHSRGLTRG